MRRTEKEVLRQHIQVIVENILATILTAQTIKERKRETINVVDVSNIKSIIDMSNNLSKEQKELLDEKLLKSGGILRDYDRNELLFPLNITVYGLLQNMLKHCKANL